MRLTLTADDLTPAQWSWVNERFTPDPIPPRAVRVCVTLVPTSAESDTSGGVKHLEMGVADCMIMLGHLARIERFGEIRRTLTPVNDLVGD